MFVCSASVMGRARIFDEEKSCSPDIVAKLIELIN